MKTLVDWIGSGFVAYVLALIGAAILAWFSRANSNRAEKRRKCVESEVAQPLRALIVSVAAYVGLLICWSAILVVGAIFVALGSMQVQSSVSLPVRDAVGSWTGVVDLLLGAGTSIVGMFNVWDGVRFLMDVKIEILRNEAAQLQAKDRGKP